MENTFALSESDLEEEQTGRTFQDDRFWNLMVRRIETVMNIKSERESYISPETRRLLTYQAAALHTNKSDLISEIHKALRQLLQRYRKERIQKVSVEIEENCVAKNVIGTRAILRV